MSKNIWKYDLIFENCDAVELHRTLVKSVDFGEITKTVFSANRGEKLVITERSERLTMEIENSALEKTSTMGVTLRQNLTFSHLTHVRIWMDEEYGITFLVPWGDVDSFDTPNPYESHIFGAETTIIIVEEDSE